MEENKPTYEQLELQAKFWQGRAAQAEQNIASINFATLRLEYLFKVLNYSEHFDKAFVDKCAEEVKSLLDINAQQEQVGK